MLLAELVATADAVAATSARTAKRDALATRLRSLAPDEIVPAVGFLIGDPRQGRIGVGWATVSATTAAPARQPTLTIGDVDAYLDRMATSVGPGSTGARQTLLGEMFGRATPAEAEFLRRLLVGELRQGALEGVMTDAVARAADVPATAVRRAFMLSGDLRQTAAIALTSGRRGLDDVGLTVFRPVQPMLAATADDPGAAIEDGRAVAVEWKLDGARIQVHRDGDEVQVFTRNLNDVTDRLPEVVVATLALPATRLVLDGEALGLTEEQRPYAFQDTMSRFGRDEADTHPMRLRPFFFDVLHVDGEDLVDRPLSDRIAALDDVAHDVRIPGIVTAEVDEARSFLASALAHGHEGVMVKALESPYQAGRRGKAWRKVKPVLVVDLVVLAAEWGHGRRRGWLSNLHLGARDPDTGGFVMVGKTFKGLTDELLAWQTRELLDRELAREGIVVHVRPDLVVETGLDGVQASTRYPGGVALRFARVRRYRPDKPADQTDTIDSLRARLVR